MQILKLPFYSDASHGWIRVKRSLLVQLNILNLISAYSYQSKTGKYVYVEEDGDAQRLVEALEGANIEFTLMDVDHGDRSRIRSLPGFKP